MKNNITQVLFFVVFFCASKIYGQISGPSFVLPEVTNVYGFTPGAGTALMLPYSWSCNSSNVTVAGSAITVKKQETNCQITITFNYYYYFTSDANQTPNQGSASIVVTVLPRIIIPTFYPGENLNLTIQDNCSHTGCNYNWNVSPTAVCPSCGPTGTSTQPIYINPLSVPNSIDVNCTISNCSPTVPLTALTIVSSIVKLRNPVISGPTQIGCVGSPPVGSFIYSAPSQYGATYYVWTVPSFLTPLTSLTGSGNPQLTVIENALGSGNITLQTFNGQGSFVQSDIVNYPIQVCCRSQYDITSNVSSPSTDIAEAAINLNVFNTINNGASAKYHAGSEVRLKPGFSALAGSYFHGYIEGCTGNYYRVINPNINNDQTEAETLVDLNYPTKNSIGDVSNSNASEVLIIPNPTTGIFKVRTNNYFEFPKQIIIRDIMSRNVKVLTNINTFENEFNLQEENSGVYMISIYYSDKVISKRVIKQ
jgi:hypothetical protein